MSKEERVTSLTDPSPSARPWHSPPPDETDEVLIGLRAAHKRLPAKLLYDPRGAKLFDRICTLDAYYLTRTEVALLAQHLPAIAAQVGTGARVIEPGSGEGIKTRMLLDALDHPSCYVPIDVCGEQLVRTAELLRDEHPGLDVHPVCADYMARLELPAIQHAHTRSLVFFPGSTIGNLEPDDARAFLARLAELAGPRGLLLLGADSTDDPDVLLRAYDDEDGVTAEFNLNVLRHLNRIRSAAFDPSTFVHRAIWSPEHSRIEMHLVSRCSQTVLVAGVPIHFKRGESIVTEHCYKYPPALLSALLHDAGWHVRRVFTDDDRPVRLWLAERA
jgi:dimethylhistidine N-methyltransferase